MFVSDKPVVEDSEEIRAICRKYCRICEIYSRHHLRGGYYCVRR
jgi:hypothetical protein